MKFQPSKLCNICKQAREESYGLWSTLLVWKQLSDKNHTFSSILQLVLKIEFSCRHFSKGYGYLKSNMKVSKWFVNFAGNKTCVCETLMPPAATKSNMAKISKSYILTPPYPQGQVMSEECEQPLDELTVQVWLLYHHPNFEYCTLFESGTELQTDGQTDRQTDNPITRCPRQTFQAGGIKKQNKTSRKLLKSFVEWHSN